MMGDAHRFVNTWFDNHSLQVVYTKSQVFRIPPQKLNNLGLKLPSA